MKMIQSLLARFTMAFLAVLVSVITFAQEKSTDVNVNIGKDDGGNWYAQPWVWIVGVAVFILLLVALLRGSGRRSAD